MIAQISVLNQTLFFFWMGKRLLERKCTKLFWKLNHSATCGGTLFVVSL